MKDNRIHRQYIRIIDIPENQIEHANVGFVFGYIKIGEYIRGMRFNDFYNAGEIQKLLHEKGIELKLLPQKTRKLLPFIAGHRIRKLHGDLVIPIKAETEEELILEISKVKNILNKRGITYDNMCRWLCIS